MWTAKTTRRKGMHPSWTHRFTVPFLASILLVVFLAGCGSSSTGSGSTPSANPTLGSTPTPKPALTKLTDYCTLVSLAEVSQVTGLTITQVTPIPNEARQQVVCGYVANVATSTGAVIIFFVSPTAGQAQTILAALKQQAQSRGATVADLSGIGDQAFSATQNGVESVEALKGAVVFTVSGTTPHPLPLAVDKPLAQLVASRL
jgi:hypothetical protein